MSAVERLELIEVHPLDVAADAALGERERHPRLEVLDHSWGDVGMRRDVVVEPISVRVHQLLEPLGALGVERLERVGIDEELHAQILVDLRFALRLGEPAHRVDVVRFDAIEVVLGLRVLEPEDRVRVGLAVDVGDAPVVAGDRDVLRLAFPRGQLGGGRLRLLRRERRGGGEQDQHAFHDKACLSLWNGLARRELAHAGALEDEKRLRSERRNCQNGGVVRSADAGFRGWDGIGKKRMRGDVLFEGRVEGRASFAPGVPHRPL